MEIKVLGSGCSKCRVTIGMIERVARDLGVAVEITKVQNAEEIQRHGVHATPAVIIDGKIMHSGGLPSHDEIQGWLKPGPMGFLSKPTRHLFFTGKGGVGKTSLSTAVALTLADAGKKVLLVSTDAASNLDEMLGIELRNTPTPVPGAPGLSVLNIDPDTAPTGHTLRLLSLPKAWSGFLDGNDRGASCLGPHSGLKMQEGRFKAALDALSDTTQTTVILVTRPDKGAMAEALRTSKELHALGLNNQRLAINGVFHASERTDTVACAIEALGQQALAEMPQALRALPQDRVPLRAFDTVGLPALRMLLAVGVDPIAPGEAAAVNRLEQLQGLDALADELATASRGLIMVMGKGGVGKTTVAAALAVGLIQRGKTVHLSTTDPAAHLAGTLDGEVAGLRVDRIRVLLNASSPFLG
jgi:arsenite-transporting ATPase